MTQFVTPEEMAEMAKQMAEAAKDDPDVLPIVIPTIPLKSIDRAILDELEEVSSDEEDEGPPSMKRACLVELVTHYGTIDPCR